MHKFMIKIVLKDSNLSGYKWIDGKKPEWLECYTEVEAATLSDAVDIVLKKYNDKKKYWVKPSESYMKLEL